jgi:ABC-type lipoprotein export system ATPase subunit
MQLEGLFDIPPSEQTGVAFEADLPIENIEWHVGLIVGPSGCGKTSLARELFGGQIVSGFDWPEEKSIIDGFPEKMGINEITGLLSSVGFSSPPSWLWPFRVLSNGEQFRATMARAMAESSGLIVIDEFTSVVDRTVAKIGSHAIAKAVRRRGFQLIALSCHYDVADWLEPDWIHEPATNEFSRRFLRRPEIRLEVRRVDADAWRVFKRHHYLSGDLARSSRCFIALIEGQPAAFCSVISFPHPSRSGYREHRTVCLPDFQGVGIGNALSEFIAGVFRATGKPYFSTTSSPSMILHRAKSKLWKMKRKPYRKAAHHKAGMREKSSNLRITGSFEYVGPVRTEEARGFGII